MTHAAREGWRVTQTAGIVPADPRATCVPSLRRGFASPQSMASCLGRAATASALSLGGALEGVWQAPRSSTGRAWEARTGPASGAVGFCGGASAPSGSLSESSTVLRRLPFVVHRRRAVPCCASAAALHRMQWPSP